MDRVRVDSFREAERRIYHLVAQSDGLRARQIASLTGIPRADVNRELYLSYLMKDLCYQDGDYRWHALIRQTRPHGGLYDYSGWYGTVSEFRALDESAFLSELQDGCRRIGRSLNDQRGLIHSFTDCRRTMITLFDDLDGMLGAPFGGWELVFELRIRRGKWIRIYSDVLLITESRVFSLEFKMKDTVLPEEILQSAKYSPYQEIIFGPEYDILPVLVLTGAKELFSEAPIPGRDGFVPVCSGDMLFNALNYYLGFLR